MSNKEANIILAESSKSSAKLFNYGNIAAVVIAPPLFIFWFGASIAFYAMLRHHPNERVGYYTQIAAYQYYALAGLLVPLFTFAPPGLTFWLVIWAVYIVILVPLAIIQLIKINREEWKDVNIKSNKH